MRQLSRLSRRTVHLLLMNAVLVSIWAFPLQMTVENIGVLRSVVMTPGVEAQIAGSVWKIETQVGAQVEEEDVLLILESMKMETKITVPEKLHGCTVTSIIAKIKQPLKLNAPVIGWSKKA